MALHRLCKDQTAELTRSDGGYRAIKKDPHLPSLPERERRASLLVELLGGSAGIAVALGAIAALSHWIPLKTFADAAISINGPVLFSAVLVLFSVFAFGLGPALQSTRSSVQTELKEGATSHRIAGAVY